MHTQIRDAGIHHVNDITRGQKALVEKALFMRAQSYLAHVKSQLLMRTIFEVNVQRKQLERLNQALNGTVQHMAHKQARLEAEIVRRKQVEHELQQAHAAIEEAGRIKNERWEQLVEDRTLELQHAKEAAEAANRAKNAFLTNMSHELRTPLHAILGFTQLMTRAQDTTPAQHDRLDIIKRAGEHLLAMINDVLELTKIEAGQIGLHSNVFDLREMFQSVAEIFKFRADGKHLSFRLELDDKAFCYIKADQGKLRQILSNLLDNAVKFTEHGGIVLRARCSSGADEGHDILQLEVEDSGIGIVAEHLHRVFEPFTEAAAAHFGHKGSGLGLAISRSFIELMGGTIEVQSTVGKGSLFRVEIPLETLPIPPQQEARNDREETVQAEPRTLCAESLARLPRELLENLLDAVLSLDAAKIGEVAEHIKHHETSVAESILALAEKYRYEQLMELCQQVLEKNT